MFLLTPATFTPLSFLFIRIFRMAWGNGSKFYFFVGRWHDFSLEINCYCIKSSILIFTISTYSVYFLQYHHRPCSFSKISVTSETFSSDILICFGFIDLYSVVDSTIPVSLRSSLVDVGASDLSRKHVLRNLIVKICLLFFFFFFLGVVVYRQKLFSKLFKDI